MTLGLRTKLAIICAKATGAVIQKLSRRGGGSVYPGYIARLIDPGILPVMAKMIRGKITVTMGTNGKTTVNNMICHMLETKGKKIVINRTGANMLNGVISAFVLAAGWDGKLEADYACIEVDEFASLRILPELKPDCVLLTNIFRDQIDRYGEIDTIRDRIKRAVSLVPEAVFAVNCDDFLSYTLALECGNPVTSYGINEKIFHDASDPEVKESVFCRSCGEKLKYDIIQYGQLGIYCCPRCGWERPRPDHTAADIAFQDGRYIFSLDGVSVLSQATAPYNVYNTLAAYTVIKILDASADQIPKAVETFDYGNGREGLFMINKSRVQLHLAKNPVGFQQKIALLIQDSSQKDIIIQINDCSQDGKDISWLWDVDFQYLQKANAATIVSAGIRRLDMALRLKYEDICCEPADDIKEAVEQLSVSGTGNLYIIVNYSGLSETGRMLRRLQASSKKKEQKNDREREKAG